MIDKKPTLEEYGLSDEAVESLEEYNQQHDLFSTYCSLYIYLFVFLSIGGYFYYIRDTSLIGSIFFSAGIMLFLVPMSFFLIDMLLEVIWKPFHKTQIQLENDYNLYKQALQKYSDEIEPDRKKSYSRKNRRRYRKNI